MTAVLWQWREGKLNLKSNFCICVIFHRCLQPLLFFSGNELLFFLHFCFWDRRCCVPWIRNSQKLTPFMSGIILLITWTNLERLISEMGLAPFSVLKRVGSIQCSSKWRTKWRQQIAKYSHTHTHTHTSDLPSATPRKWWHLPIQSRHWVDHYWWPGWLHSWCCSGLARASCGSRCCRCCWYWLLHGVLRLSRVL